MNAKYLIKKKREERKKKSEEIVPVMIQIFQVTYQF